MPTSAVISEQAVGGSAFESPDTDGAGVADLDVTRLVRRAASGDPLGVGGPRRSVWPADLVDHQGLQARSRAMRRTYSRRPGCG